MSITFPSTELSPSMIRISEPILNGEWINNMMDAVILLKMDQEAKNPMPAIVKKEAMNKDTPLKEIPQMIPRAANNKNNEERL